MIRERTRARLRAAGARDHHGDRNLVITEDKLT
ncbi:MAG: hypothetical protein ACYCZB_02845 [Acidiphilium sp.]